MKKIEYPLGAGRYDRPELEMLGIKEPREAVTMLEERIAKFAGALYGVAVDSLTNGLFLACKWRQQEGIRQDTPLTVPMRTYCSVPMALMHAGHPVYFVNNQWEGAYRIGPVEIWDSATRFAPGMYVPGSLYVLSFQHKKRLNIGKGGMILTNDKAAYEWLMRARFEGRNPDANQWDDEYAMIGWNMYMTPDDAARGLLIFDELLKEDAWDDWASYENYPDLSEKKVFN